MPKKSLTIEYAHHNRAKFLSSLKELLTIPSVSTDPEHKPDIERAAEWLAAHLKSIGMENVRIMPTNGSPIVYGEWLHAGEKAPVILIYGHYDVQPVDPIYLWKSPPFTPEIRGDNLYARGASDMKGQLLSTVCAVESLLKTGNLHVNIKFILEGEEETGSPNMAEFLARECTLLASDLALNPDTGMIAPDQPTIVYGLRGLTYFELRLFGPDHDLHSGQCGGVVHNTAQALCEVIAGMHDADGHVTLPGFYDRVRPVKKDEKAQLSLLHQDDQYYLNQTGVPKLWGEPEYAPTERVSARPTLEINGLQSGFTGSGTKTVIPAKAMAKISMRLVPDQDPEEVNEQLRAYLDAHVPVTIRWELEYFGGSAASITDRENFGVKALSKAFKKTWNKEPVFKREGASIPIVLELQKELGIDSVLTGFSLPDDSIHAPNEKLHLPTWERGIDTLIHFFFNLEEKK